MRDFIEDAIGAVCVFAIAYGIYLLAYGFGG